MSDQGQVKLEDSNLANYGSKEHRELRKEAAKKEQAWKEVGKKQGVLIWRIEKFEVKEWPTKHYGEFYNGDSYIILHTYKEEDKNTFSYDVYFWLGAETTQDEAGTAAYKTVELDDLLDDMPVQHREVQGMETKKFRVLFPRITILEGGIESGFNHVEPTEYKPRLLHVVGEGQNVQVYQVKQHPDNLNSVDSFVLDLGEEVYTYNGKKSSVWEKRQANSVVDNIQSERGDKVKKTHIIEGFDDKSDEASKFWEYFGEKPDNISNERVNKKPKNIEKTIQKISDSSGHMEMNEIRRGKIYKNDLDTNDVFIIDNGDILYIWVGNKSNKKERAQAMKRGDEYLKVQTRTKIPMVRIIEGRETKEFLACFDGDTAPKKENNISSSSNNNNSSSNGEEGGCCVIL